jgi:hypothetical protein
MLMAYDEIANMIANTSREPSEETNRRILAVLAALNDQIHENEQAVHIAGRRNPPCELCKARSILAKEP